MPDTEFTGYPACRISGNSKSRIPDIRPDMISKNGRISGTFLFKKKKLTQLTAKIVQNTKNLSQLLKNTHICWKVCGCCQKFAPPIKKYVMLLKIFGQHLKICIAANKTVKKICFCFQTKFFGNLLKWFYKCPF